MNTYNTGSQDGTQPKKGFYNTGSQDGTQPKTDPRAMADSSNDKSKGSDGRKDNGGSSSGGSGGGR